MRFVLVASLASACAVLERSPLPQTEAPVTVVVTGSECPAYRIAVHQDGLVEYWADRNAEVSGVGWLRVSPDVVGRLQTFDVVGKTELAPEWPVDPVCKAFDVSAFGIAVRVGDLSWRFCDVNQGVEEQVLRILGLPRFDVKRAAVCRFGA